MVSKLLLHNAFAGVLALSLISVSLRAGQGDSDNDNDIDLVDFGSFQLCFTQPPEPRASPDCGVFDFNGDGIVNLDDYAAFQDAFFGPEVIPPIITDTALILGKVFHAETEEPLEGATITAVFYPAEEGEPDLPPLAMSDSAGIFQYESVPFAGEATFLVRIRKDGFAENLRQATVLAGRCMAVDDAYLNPVNPPVMVEASKGAVIEDVEAGITLDIPPGALMQDSLIGVTKLASHLAVRDDLPQLVATAGTFVDIAGVFGDETLEPVTMRIPNEYDLPLGTEVRFGKIDHNTLEWMDLSEAFGGEGDVGVGVVVTDDKLGTAIEVPFDHFCTVCTGYCLPVNVPGIGKAGDRIVEGESKPGDSVISLRDGYLSEDVVLPPFRETGRPWGLTLGYYSGAASPSITLSAQVDYNSTRPVERTILTFSIEGMAVEAAYDYSEDNQKPIGTFFWNGTNGLGDVLPTGSYPYSIFATSLNAEVPVAISDIFGGEATQEFAGITYPGLTPLRSDVAEGRTTLLNLTNSPYGAGWSIFEEHRLYIDPDGHVVLVPKQAYSPEQRAAVC